ncbi:hypothetical protein [Thalassospira xiamenensis]|uniref:Uncharacterized protein n=1 Tax=Thalassospira xiamenensis TaxID=220697 RepID=A0A367XAN2_9PROT|nr:hypothetical protein [Thalassospira xiamenensis]KZB53029.1 hypothetical protein AUP41_03055 [Thalassospira xiamenensis]RCK50647.1 hypothetical protein TH44_11770 [Thalassospira xiamenensis]
MSWQDFLATTALLHDLHDKVAEPGSSEKSTPPIDRPTLKNGYWLTLGLAILEYLREREEDENQTMLPLSEFFAYYSRLYPNVTLEDVRYVVSILSSSRAIAFLTDEQILIPEENTALLLHPPHSLSLMGLTSTGRRAIGLSKSLSDGRFTDLTAQQLHRLIEDGDYVNSLKVCKGLSTNLRDLGRAITSLLEQAADSELRDSFLKFGPRYESTIIETGKIIRSASIALESLEEDDQAADVILELEGSLEKLDTSIERIRRSFVELLRKLNTGELHYQGHYRFDLVLEKWITDQRDDVSTFEQLAAFTSPQLFNAPIIDPLEISHTLSPTTELQEVGSYMMPSPVSDTPTTPVWLQQLFEKHRSYLKARLPQGPLSLSELLTDETFSITDLPHAVALIGATFNISEEFGKVGVALASEQSSLSGPTFRVTFDDIIIYEEKGDS